MTNPANEASSIDWDFTLDTIIGGRCILFLGPELYTSADGKKVEDALLDFLQYPENGDILNYYPSEGLFLFKNKGAQTKTYYKIKNFFQQSFPDAEELLEIRDACDFFAGCASSITTQVNRTSTE